MRTALRTGDGFGVKTSVQRILIFLTALRTQIEFRHGSVLPVIGQGLNYRVARPALGAVGEWILITTVTRGAHFLQAIRAGEIVRRNMNRRTALVIALYDRKTCSSERLYGLNACNGGFGYRGRF